MHFISFFFGLCRNNTEISNKERKYIFLKFMEIRREQQINHPCFFARKEFLANVRKSQVKGRIGECVYIVRERQRGARCLVKSTEIECSFLWSARRSIAPFQYVNPIQPPGTLESFL